MVNEVSTIKNQLTDTESHVYHLDDTISKLPTRVLNVRQMNYRIQTNFETDQVKAAERWASIGPSMKMEVKNKAAMIRMEITALEGDINARRNYPSVDIGSLSGLETRLNTQKLIVYDFSKRIQESLVSVTSVLTPLEQGLSTAESVIKLTSAASYPWKESETSIVAVHAKDMNKNMEGILTLTNLRLIYESEIEIVLKKTFFIVTEKKKERRLVFEQPIGSISKITKGRVGLLAGAGLFIEFKQSEPELKLDTKSEEADLVIKYFGLITSGQIDEELYKQKPETPKSSEKRMLSCPKCGAPYTDEVYRGQLTVKCKYCNTIITIQ